MPERGQTSGFTVSEYLYLLNHTESLSITISSFQLCSVPYLSHCSLFDEALRNELCVLKRQVFVYLSQFCLFSAGTSGHLYTVCKKLPFVYLAYKKVVAS